MHAFNLGCGCLKKNNGAMNSHGNIGGNVMGNIKENVVGNV